MSCKAAESIEDAVLRMARVNSNKKISVRKDRDEMSVQLLDKTRKINKLLHNNNSSKVVFNDICEVLTEILLSNVLVISRKGKILGVSECEGVEEITELISDKVGGYIDPLLNERLLGVLSTKENVNLETLGFGPEVKKYQAIITPIDIAGERLGTLFPIQYANIPRIALIKQKPSNVKPFYDFISAIRQSEIFLFLIA